MLRDNFVGCSIVIMNLDFFDDLFSDSCSCGCLGFYLLTVLKYAT